MQKNQNLKNMKDLPGDLTGKNVLVRVDFNVPMDDQNRIMDTSRIDASRDTIMELVGRGARVALLTHVEKDKRTISTIHLKDYLETALNVKVSFVKDCTLPFLCENLSEIKPGKEIILLENVRFYMEEKEGDIEFAKKLAEPFDYFIMDGFAVSHRPHASIRVGEILPAYAGYLMEKELSVFGNIDKLPRPSLLIIGGSKVSSKITLLENLIGNFDKIAIVGGMSHTFLKALGCMNLNSENSCAEDNMLQKALEILEKSVIPGKLERKIVLPTDVTIFDGSRIEVVPAGEVPEKGWEIMDAGPTTIEIIKELCKRSASIVWNGPLGVFEVKPFDTATNAIAHCIADDVCVKAYCGGGDTARAIRDLGENVFKSFNYVSTGGGALLEYWEGIELPGVKILKW